MAVNPNALPQDKESTTEISLKILPFSLKGYGLRLVVNKETSTEQSTSEGASSADFDRRPRGLGTLSATELEIWPVRQEYDLRDPIIFEEWDEPDSEPQAPTSLLR